MHAHCPQLTYSLPLHAQSPTSSRSSYTSESEWSTASDSSEERERQRSRRRRRRARKHRSKSKRDRSDGGASYHSGAASRKASSSVQAAPPQPQGDMSDVGASTACGCARGLALTPRCVVVLLAQADGPPLARLVLACRDGGAYVIAAAAWHAPSHQQRTGGFGRPDW